MNKKWMKHSPIGYTGVGNVVLGVIDQASAVGIFRNETIIRLLSFHESIYDRPSQFGVSSLGIGTGYQQCGGRFLYRKMSTNRRIHPCDVGHACWDRITTVSSSVIGVPDQIIIIVVVVVGYYRMVQLKRFYHLML